MSPSQRHQTIQQTSSSLTSINFIFNTSGRKKRGGDKSQRSARSILTLLRSFSRGKKEKKKERRCWLSVSLTSQRDLHIQARLQGEAEQINEQSSDLHTHTHAEGRCKIKL